MTIDPGARTTELRKRGSCVRRTISAAREGKLELRPASPPATPDSEHPDALLRLVELEIDVVVRASWAVSYTHLRAHETALDIVCRLLLEKKTHIIILMT